MAVKSATYTIATTATRIDTVDSAVLETGA